MKIPNKLKMIIKSCFQTQRSYFRKAGEVLKRLKENQRLKRIFINSVNLGVVLASVLLTLYFSKGSVSVSETEGIFDLTGTLNNIKTEVPPSDAPKLTSAPTWDIGSTSLPTFAEKTATPGPPITEITPGVTPPPSPTPTKTENAVQKTIDDKPIKLYLTEENRYTEITLEEYIIGATLAEMSYKSHIEARKAQAVAIRSYVYFRMIHGNTGHIDSAICDSHAHCMGYRSLEDTIERFGEEKGIAIWEDTKKAVRETKGEYITYDGKCINAMFHHSSYGKTESYKNLYGSNIPWLKSVDTPEEAGEYTASFDMSDIIKLLFTEEDYLKIYEPLGSITYFEDSGRTNTVTLFGKEFKASELRLKLGLQSTSLICEFKDGQYIFTCRGFGHGVGMSQEGACLLAKSGIAYREIIEKYYSDCEIIVKIIE